MQRLVWKMLPFFVCIQLMIMKYRLILGQYLTEGTTSKELVVLLNNDLSQSHLESVYAGIYWNPTCPSLVPRPHPLRGEGSGEKQQDPWAMMSSWYVIIRL